ERLAALGEEAHLPLDQPVELRAVEPAEVAVLDHPAAHEPDGADYGPVVLGVDPCGKRIGCPPAQLRVVRVEQRRDVGAGHAVTLLVRKRGATGVVVARMAEERRPAIVAVDDEPAVLAAVARDLRRGFGERYRILRAASGAEALELLRQLRARGDQVALLIADQRMAGMPRTEYLVGARNLVPDAKRVLLTD